MPDAEFDPGGTYNIINNDYTLHKPKNRRNGTSGEASHITCDDVFARPHLTLHQSALDAYLVESDGKVESAVAEASSSVEYRLC